MFRPFLTFLAVGIIMLAPVSASAATVDFFGPIVSPECNCRDLVSEEGFNYVSAPDWGCVLQTVQNAISFGVSIIIIMITLMIAYSGIMFMASPTNAEHRSRAKSMITNALIGLVIVLTSWLIVDFIMKALYNPDATKGYTKGEALPWYRILGDDATSDKLCFKPVNLPQPATGGGQLNVAEPGSGQNPGDPVQPDDPDTTPSPTSNNGTATEVPQTPKYFSAVAGSSAGEIQLAWGPENDVDSYQIDRAIETRLNSGTPGTFKKVAELDGTKTDYRDTMLASGLLYYYRLFAFNEAGVSPVPARTQAVTKGSSGTTPTTPPTSTTPAQSDIAIAAKVCAAAKAFEGEPTTACQCGGNACAWAVDQVLGNAGLKKIGTKQVVTMESALKSSRGRNIGQSSAVCGDIVVITGTRTKSGGSANHIGVCLNTGCSSVISNSSSKKSFTWRSDPAFSDSYVNAQPRFYRVTN